MKSNPNRPVQSYIDQGEMILHADHIALGNNSDWALVDTMRSLLHRRISSLKIKTKRLNDVVDRYSTAKAKKKRAFEDCREALERLRVYIENAFFQEQAEVLEHVGLVERPPKAEKKLISYWENAHDALSKYNDKRFPLPNSYIDAVGRLPLDLDGISEELANFRSQKALLTKERERALDEFRDLLPPIRRWLWK